MAKTISAGFSDEPLVQVSHNSKWITHPIYHREGVKGALTDIWVRKGVYERLSQVADALQPHYRLVLLDGWRPKEVQALLYRDMHLTVARNNPHLKEEEVDRLTQQFAALPSDDPVSPSPHLTGGSVDLTLADQTGRLLDMGSNFDEPNDRSWTGAPVEPRYAERRTTLLEATRAAGFTNLPSEWWHYDYGNWVWAWYSSQSAAYYGPTQLPRDSSAA